ncbi:MAG: GLPGLI family protein [Flavobacteriaceae bacterium]|nr:MAG: GLPGLI family protein [Flavobacteriaceae bacterium]
MRNFKYYFLIVCLCNFSLYSQNKTGIVTYKQRLVSNKVFSSNSVKEGKVRENIEMFNKVLKKNSNKFEYSLIFKDNKSYYKREISIEKDIDKFAIMLTGGDDEYYQDLLKKTKIKKLNAYGEEFNITSNLVDEEWTLINETKKIESYICYKAMSFEIIKSRRGTFRKKIVAWYAPSLPYNFGPKGYGGLPGLILELNEGKIQYYVKKIILNPSKRIEINKPSKGKLVTLEEFNEINRKMTKRWYK